MSTYQNLIRFYHDCYGLDNSNFGIQNVLSNAVINRSMLKSDYFVSGDWPTDQINNKVGDKLFRAMQVYKREKELHCCFYFLNFRVSTPRGQQTVITPLYLLKPYLFRKNNNYFLASDNTTVSVNPYALRMLASLAGMSTGELAEKIPIGFLDTRLKADLSIFFTEYLPKVNIDRHINNVPVKLIKTLNSYRKYPGVHLIPGSLIGLFKKDGSSLGVLAELKIMAKSKMTSAPLNSILNDKTTKTNKAVNKNIIVPINLNLAQEKVLANYPMFNNLIVSGPPGTGKTLSIGAIVCDAVIKGKSVLIATKNDEPLNVVERMLQEKFDLGKIFLRGGSKSNRTKISKRLRAIKKEVIKRDYKGRSISYIKGQIKQGQSMAATSKRKIEKGKKLTYQISELLDKAQNSYFKSIQLELTKYRKQGLELNQLLHKKNKTQAATNELIFEYMRERIYYYLSKYAWNRWDGFEKILKSMTTRNKFERVEKIADLDTGLLLKLFPIWGVTSGTVGNYLPLKKEMFDLVIIDEASKSDIPSTLPLLYRAKQAIIIGDPKQMRHVSFLSTKLIEQLVTKYELKHSDQYKLNYRSNSILDICISASDSSEQFVQLREHYRSYPEMIQFSNKQFYNNSLKAFQLPRELQKKLSLNAIRVKGDRGKNGVNKREALEVFNIIKRLVLEQRGLKQELVQSIGVISPFRAQANYLQKEITKSFSADILERHQIVVGTPYAFQGDEKDYMILSFALDNKSLKSSHYLESEGVFNVAITRARKRQFVLYSFDYKKLNENSILRNYIEYLNINHHRVKSYFPAQPKTGLVSEIYNWLSHIPETKVLFNHNLSVFILDFLVLKGKRKIFIDLVGFEGTTHPMLSEAKYDLLYRLEVEIYVLTYRQWKEDKSFAKREIWDFIHSKKRGIHRKKKG